LHWAPRPGLAFGPASARAGPAWQLCGTLHTLSAKDERLASRHLETSTVFSGFLNTIQNNLIEAIGDVIRYDIKKISAARFVPAEIDESKDVTNKAQISVII